MPSPYQARHRLYVSYWHGGAVILDISDLSSPRCISTIDWSPPYAWPTHTVTPVDFAIYGHRWMLVADEHVVPLDPEMSPELPAAIWMLNITDETRPIPVSTFQVPELVGKRAKLMSGCHQPIETITRTEVPVAWFANGLRVIDIANPHALREVAHYLPEVPPGAERVSSNDVFVDPRGVIYLIDRNRGLSILERS